MSLGARVVQLRKEQGLSQKVLAERSGLRVQNLWRLEQCTTRHVRSDVLIRLCIALQISADWLLGLGEDLPGHLGYEGTEPAVLRTRLAGASVVKEEPL